MHAKYPNLLLSRMLLVNFSFSANRSLSIEPVNRIQLKAWTANVKL